MICSVSGGAPPSAPAPSAPAGAGGAIAAPPEAAAASSYGMLSGTLVTPPERWSLLARAEELSPGALMAGSPSELALKASCGAPPACPSAELGLRPGSRVLEGAWPATEGAGSGPCGAPPLPWLASAMSFHDRSPPPGAGLCPGSPPGAPAGAAAAAEEGSCPAAALAAARGGTLEAAGAEAPGWSAVGTPPGAGTGGCLLGAGLLLVPSACARGLA